MKIFAILVLIACARRPVLRPFTSDGCSLFPDKDFQRDENWCSCCIDHDFAYWQGGPDSARLKADKALKKCIMHATGDSVLARMVYSGTRIGGSRRLPSWYRWGYGWPYFMKSIPDSTRARMVKERSDVDLAAIRRNICAD